MGRARAAHVLEFIDFSFAHFHSPNLTIVPSELTRYANSLMSMLSIGSAISWMKWGEVGGEGEGDRSDVLSAMVITR